VEALQVIKCALRNDLLTRDPAPMSSLEFDILGDGKTIGESCEGTIDLDSDCEVELDNLIYEETAL
jgi:hypothetical protein